MKNNMPCAVEVFYRIDQTVTSCGVVQPGKKFNAPLAAVYTPDGHFLLKPQDSG